MTIQESHSPECKSSDILVFKNKYQELLFCKNCSLLYKKNIKELKKEVLLMGKFNKDLKQTIETDHFKKQISENRSIIKKILIIIKKNPTKILDYGCGYGAFMFAAKELGFTVNGYDINENFTENLSNYFETFKSETDLLNNQNSKKYDLIFCRKVLNLSSNIYKDFSNFNDLLSSNGHLVIMDQVKNLSKHKSMISKNDTNCTLLVTVETLKFYANIFQLNVKYIKNDFGDLFIIFEKSNKNYKVNKISIETLKNLEKFSFIFLFLSKIKNIIQKIYYLFKSYRNN